MPPLMDELRNDWRTGGGNRWGSDLRNEVRGQFDHAALDSNGLILPQYQTFNAFYNTFSRMWSYRWDEAIRDSQENADAIERDAMTQSLMQERVLPLGLHEWEIKVDEYSLPAAAASGPAGLISSGKDPYGNDRERVRQALAGCVGMTDRFEQLRYALGMAVYYGRYGWQVRWDRGTVYGERRTYAGYGQPVHGDKIHFTWDGQPGVLINGKFKGAFPDVRMFDAYGPVAVLGTSGLRDRFLIATHLILDAPYLNPQQGGRVEGVGLRDFMYWGWYIREELVGWVLDYMQKVGAMGLTVFYYEEGNAASQARAEKAAREISGRSALAVPVPKNPTDRQASKVDLIPANTGGVQFLIGVIRDWVEKWIERMWVGQSMSAGADSESGLGGTGRADFAKDTKHKLLLWDAVNQAATLTRDLVRPLMKFNFPGCPWRFNFEYRLPDPTAKDRLDGVKNFAQFMKFRLDDVHRDLGTTKPGLGEETVGGPAVGGTGGWPGGAGGDAPGSPAVPPGSPPDAPGSAVPPAALTEMDATGLGEADSSTPGIPELVAAMFAAAGEGDLAAVDRLAELGSDPETLGAIADDSEDVPGGNADDSGGIAYTSVSPVALYEWASATTKSGHLKAVWSGAGHRGPLYGERARKALQGDQKGKTPEAELPQAKAKRLATDREPAREAARQAYRKALADPASVQPHELPALAAHLHTLTRDEIRATLGQQGQSTWGRVKPQLVEALLNYVRQGMGGSEVTDRQAIPPQAPRDYPDAHDIERETAAADKAQRMNEWAGAKPESMAAEGAARAANARLSASRSPEPPEHFPSNRTQPEPQKPTAPQESPIHHPDISAALSSVPPGEEATISGHQVRRSRDGELYWVHLPNGGTRVDTVGGMAKYLGGQDAPEIEQPVKPGGPGVDTSGTAAEPQGRVDSGQATRGGGVEVEEQSEKAGAADTNDRRMNTTQELSPQLSPDAQPKPAISERDAVVERMKSDGYKPAESKAPGVSHGDVPFDLAKAAHNGTSFVPERRAVQRQDDYVHQMNADWEYLSQFAKTPEEKNRLNGEFERYRQGYLQKYKDQLSATSRVMSPMITGPARFPVDSNRKKSDSADKRSLERREFRERAIKAIKKKFAAGAQSGAIQSNDPEATRHLQGQLDSLKKRHEMMTKANEIVRQFARYTPGKFQGSSYTGGKTEYKAGKTEQGLRDALKAAGYGDALIGEIVKPNYMGKIGFEPYQLTNNGANIRRIEGRIQEITKMREGPSKQDSYSGGVRVSEDPEAARIRIHFPGKPDRAAIDKLKSSGFRWSPSEGAWQRHLNNGGRYAVDRVLADLGHQKEQASTQPVEDESVPDEIVNNDDLSDENGVSELAKPEISDPSHPASVAGLNAAKTERRISEDAGLIDAEREKAAIPGAADEELRQRAEQFADGIDGMGALPEARREDYKQRIRAAKTGPEQAKIHQEALAELERSSDTTPINRNPTHAAGTREVSRNDRPQHQGDGGGRAPEEAGGRGGLEQSPGVRGESPGQPSRPPQEVTEPSAGGKPTTRQPAAVPPGHKAAAASPTSAPSVDLSSVYSRSGQADTRNSEINAAIKAALSGSKAAAVAALKAAGYSPSGDPRRQLADLIYERRNTALRRRLIYPEQSAEGKVHREELKAMSDEPLVNPG